MDRSGAGQASNAGGGPVLAPMPRKPKKIKPPKAPKAPRPLGERVVDALLLVLGVAGLGLSGWSLATLLQSAGAPMWVSCLGVGVFDLVALASGVMVYLRRGAPHTAGGARLVMMLALIASSVVNAAHGAELGGWTTAAVLGGAPLAFEVVFELRHRTLTALVWLLFRREAGEALRRDAWSRIAPVASQPGPAVEVERVTDEPRRQSGAGELTSDPAAGQEALERAVTALVRSRAVATSDPSPEEWDWAARRVDEALDEARAYGWTTQDVQEADLKAWMQRSMPDPTKRTVEYSAWRDRWAEGAQVHRAQTRAAAARPDGRASAPDPAASGQASGPGARPDVRPDVTERPDWQPPSIRAGVREMVIAGHTNPAVIGERLSAVFGRPMDMETIAREYRRARQQQPGNDNGVGTGGYA